MLRGEVAARHYLFPCRGEAQNERFCPDFHPKLFDRTKQATSRTVLKDRDDFDRNLIACQYRATRHSTAVLRLGRTVGIRRWERWSSECVNSGAQEQQDAC